MLELLKLQVSEIKVHTILLEDIQDLGSSYSWTVVKGERN